jgi:hypothetical protein
MASVYEQHRKNIYESVRLLSTIAYDLQTQQAATTITDTFNIATAYAKQQLHAQIETALINAEYTPLKYPKKYEKYETVELKRVVDQIVGLELNRIVNHLCNEIFFSHILKDIVFYKEHMPNGDIRYHGFLLREEFVR